MFKIAAMAAAAATSDSVEMSGLRHCKFKDDYTRYKNFAALDKLVDCHDSCLVVYTHMFTKGDLDKNFNLDQCELAKMCIGMGGKGEDCYWWAVDHGDMTLKDVVKTCNKKYPTLDCPAHN